NISNSALAASLLNQSQPQQNTYYGNGHSKPPKTERQDLALLSGLVLGDGGVLVPQSDTSDQQNDHTNNSSQSSPSASSSANVQTAPQPSFPGAQNAQI